MKKLITLGVITAIIAIAISCKKTPQTTNNKTVYLELPDTMTVYFKSFNNGQLNHIAKLGRVLFYDKHLSVNNTVACASCHRQELAFSDDAKFSRGYENILTGRNSMPIENLGMPDPGSNFPDVSLFWDGRSSSIEDLVMRPVSNHVEMGISDVNTLPARLAEMPYYPALFSEVFGSEEITTEKISIAIATFMAAINPENTRFDQMVRGQVKFNALEEQGMLLFNTKYPCGNCHNTDMPPPSGYSSGQSMSSFTFMDIGLDNSYKDIGRGTITGLSDDNGKFRVPNLRNVALTAPYMHDGRFNTLDEVLEHYSHGIKQSANLDDRLRSGIGRHAMQLNITAQEKQAIIAFLNTLTDYDMITDPKFSTPFKVR